MPTQGLRTIVPLKWFLNVGEPCLVALGRVRRVSATSIGSVPRGGRAVAGVFWTLRGPYRDTQGSLLHPAVVDAPSVQPVSALTARCRGRRSCGIEFGW